LEETHNICYTGIVICELFLSCGEEDVMTGTKNALIYRKPVFWVVLFLIIIIAAIIVVLSANPKSSTTANGTSYLEPPLLTPDMSVGIGVFPDYIDDETLIFHGYFGLFVYDLKEEKIAFAVDIGKAVGMTQIQGSEGAAVRVSEDGSTIQLYSYSEKGDHEKAYIIDTRTGNYKYDSNVPISPVFSPPGDIYDRFTGATLGELTYTDGKKNWLIFKDWDWAE